MRMLLDLGNTRLKWACLADATPWGAQACAWNDADFDACVTAAWRHLSGVESVLVASVVDDTREARVARLVRKTLGVSIHWVRTPAQACGVINAYAQPERLGVDRFLSMVAARAAGRMPAVLVGVGTALTLDALAADGRHLGGLIAPGPRLMEQSVLGATVRVRPDRDGAVVDAADNTADALHSGCWHAAAALVERFVERMAPACGSAPVLAVSGGDAIALSALLKLPVHHVDDAVLRGLAVWAAEFAP